MYAALNTATGRVHGKTAARNTRREFVAFLQEVVARGIFTSGSDLAGKLRRYINAYSANARPIQWKYSDPTRRLRSDEFTTTGH